MRGMGEVVKMVDIKGKMMRSDGMGWEKDIGEKIEKEGGDYLLGVKGKEGGVNKGFEEKFGVKELNNGEDES